MARAFIGLGSNVGDRAASLSAAAEALESEEAIEIVARSSVYETDPVGGPAQPRYYNQVLEIETGLTPRRLLDACQRIEARLGRHRAQEVRWGPREIDLDLLAVDGEVVRESDLTIPHPRIAERAFVLVPWAEVSPDFEIPGRGRVAALLAALGEIRGVRRL